MPETALGRLAVDEKPAAVGGEVRGARPVAAALFADDEQEADARLALAPKDVGGRHLRRQDALRVAAPRPNNRSPSTRLGKNGGTQSKCVVRTTTGVPPTTP